MSGSGLQLHKRLLLISWLIFLTTTYSQQIVTLSHFQPNYSVYDKEISLSGGNPNILKQFLHELGHHIWFYGGVDTAAYRARYSENTLEYFANEHYYYFMNETDNYNKQIFDKFYNKE